MLTNGGVRLLSIQSTEKCLMFSIIWGSADFKRLDFFSTTLVWGRICRQLNYRSIVAEEDWNFESIVIRAAEASDWHLLLLRLKPYKRPLNWLFITEFIVSDDAINLLLRF